MTEQPPSAGRPRRAFLARSRGTFGSLLAGAAAAALVAVAWDCHRATKRRREVVAQHAAAMSISTTIPDPLSSRPSLFTPGTPAPDFSLVDVRTGGRVSLADHRGRRPVVLLLSSFG